LGRWSLARFAGARLSDADFDHRGSAGRWGIDGDRVEFRSRRDTDAGANAAASGDSAIGWRGPCCGDGGRSDGWTADTDAAALDDATVDGAVEFPVVAAAGQQFAADLATADTDAAGVVDCAAEQFGDD
jgi:hypothetical protein